MLDRKAWFGQMQSFMLDKYLPGDAMLNPTIKLYDAVRIEELHKPAALSDGDIRQPQVGDVAWVIDIYENPPGYELECSDKDGTTEWVQGVRAEEIKLVKP